MKVERRLSRAMVAEHPEEAARILDRLDPADAAATMQQLPARFAAAALRFMEASGAAACLAACDDDHAREIAAELRPDSAARIVSRLEEPERERLLTRIPGEITARVRRLLDHPEGTAGALMDPRAPTVPADVAVAEARKLVQRQSRSVLYYLYVTDRSQRLVGVLNLRDLMLARPKQPLASTMCPRVQRLSVDASQEAVKAHRGWREFHALPVVDGQGVLVGVVRYETLRRLESEAVSSRLHGFESLGLALGELYWNAATVVLRGVLDLAATLTARGTRDDEEKRHGS